MPDQVTQYIEANDNADDYSESRVEALEQRRFEDIDDLFTETGGRDTELWEAFDVDQEAVVEEYEDIDEKERDLDWVMGLAGLATAATVQFFLDNREELLVKPLAYREQVLDGFTLTRAQLVTAGKRSIEIVEVQPFQALQNKFLKEVSFLNEMSNTELYNALLDYDAFRPHSQMVADASGYVSRMTSYQPGSPQFKEAVADLVDTNSKRAVKGMNRRTVERIYSYREADGDYNTLMVWIGERGGKVCDYCLNMFGEIRTYGEWIESGIIPGPSVCKGGDYCRCHLAAAGAIAA